MIRKDKSSNKKNKILFLFIGIILLLFFFRGALNHIIDGVGYLFFPVQKSIYNTGNYLKETSYAVTEYKHILEENKRLKTENVKLEYIKVKDRIQTVVYMFLAKEAVCKIFNLNIDYNNIKMKYYQPQYDDIPIEIIYNERQHELNKSNIIRYIDMINNTNYEKNDNYKYELIKNDKHCSFCEFNKLCNRQDVVYSMLEEDIYEC